MSTTVSSKHEILSRKEYESGITVYRVSSSNGVDSYATTYFNGHVTHCQCNSWEHRRRCPHAPLVEAYEAALIEEEARKQQELDAKFYYDLSTGYDSIPGLY